MERVLRVGSSCFVPLICATCGHANDAEITGVFRSSSVSVSAGDGGGSDQPTALFRSFDGPGVWDGGVSEFGALGAGAGWPVGLEGEESASLGEVTHHTEVDAGAGVVSGSIACLVSASSSRVDGYAYASSSSEVLVGFLPGSPVVARLSGQRETLQSPGDAGVAASVLRVSIIEDGVGEVGVLSDAGGAGASGLGATSAELAPGRAYTLRVVVGAQVQAEGVVGVSASVGVSFSVTIGPECRADVNGDGLVLVGDILDFLTGWAAGHSGSDVNADGQISVGDILDYLGLWSAGC